MGEKYIDPKNQQRQPHWLRNLVILAFLIVGLVTAVVHINLVVIERLNASMAVSRPLIVLNELLTCVALGIVGGGALLVYIIIEIVGGIQKRPKANYFLRIQQWCAGIMVFGLLLMVFGGFIVNPFWYKKLESAGYTRCENNLFLLSKSFTRSAWVQDESWCHDRAVYRILVKSPGPIGAERASQYLEQTYLGH